MRTPGTSSTRRWPTRRSSAASTSRTACRCAGWRRPNTFVEARRGTGQRAQLPRQRPQQERLRRRPALFAHVGDDIGDRASWRAGAVVSAHRRGRARIRGRDGSAGTTLQRPQHDLDGGRRLQMGAERQSDPDAISSCRANTSAATKAARWPRRRALADAYRAARQSGWYLQGVYQFMPSWRAGLRHDRLDRRAAPASAWSTAARSRMDAFPALASLQTEAQRA